LQSGTGVLADNAKGLHGDHVIYDDTNVEQLKSIPSSAVHREVDLAVLAADEEGYVRTYIVVPSVIYGLASGPLFDAKIANPHSVMVPALITSSIDRGRAGFVGEGKNFWPHVHIQDTAELYLVLFDNVLTNPEKVGHGWEGFYFGENGKFRYEELAYKIGDALVRSGKVSDPSPTPYTKEELGRYFGGVSIQLQHYGIISLTIRCRPSTWEATLFVHPLEPVRLGGAQSIRRRTFSRASFQRLKRSLHLVGLV
jgi:nucleoside-diphosphate-sugar epimerase